MGKLIITVVALTACSATPEDRCSGLKRRYTALVEARFQEARERAPVSNELDVLARFQAYGARKIDQMGSRFHDACKRSDVDLLTRCIDGETVRLAGLKKDEAALDHELGLEPPWRPTPWLITPADPACAPVFAALEQALY
jgi:hypothetical protein